MGDVVDRFSSQRLGGCLGRGQLIESGRRGEIQAYFAARYGNHVLAVPPREGFSLLLWTLPPLLILAGGTWFGYLLRRLRKEAIPSVPGRPLPPDLEGQPPAALIEQIEWEIQERT